MHIWQQSIRRKVRGRARDEEPRANSYLVQSLVFTVIVEPTGRAAKASRNLDYDLRVARGPSFGVPKFFALLCSAVWLRHLVRLSHSSNSAPR